MIFIIKIVQSIIIDPRTIHTVVHLPYTTKEKYNFHINIVNM